MPLYECTKCGALENTAAGPYWIEQMEAHRTGGPFKPTCSLCSYGKWHGLFEKKNAKEAGFTRVDRQGFLHRAGTE